MLSGNYKKLYSVLINLIDFNRIYHDPLYTLALGTDASFYRLIPKIVIKAQDENEVACILRECKKLNLPVTFRAAGTSLSGQAITDSVLVIAGNNWKKYTILDDGKAIQLQPGIIGSRANILLAPYGRKIGPDPASINTAMIGGIAANNASGMCCGTASNSYQTVKSMRIVFADGTILDTSCEKSKKAFSISHASLLEEIRILAEQTKNDAVLANRIAEKFKMKNTTGYSLNALIDFSDAFQIIEHLMIGSEGTLGFISEITYNTIENHAFKASSLMIFSDIEVTCNVVSLLKSAPVAAVELMDRAALRSVENEKGLPIDLKRLSDKACAILVETTANSKGDLDQQVLAITSLLKQIETEIPITFTNKPLEYALLWKIRKGLFPSVGAMRKIGTTVIIEDVTFPVARLAEATLDLQSLFLKWNYTEAVIFGHALEGNLHFVFTQNFDNQIEIDRYASFMNDVVNLVIDKYDGALKAEHGTGRNMAPFVEKEWGEQAYNLMKNIKNLFDPTQIVNPGVILNEDEQIHLKNLKPIPASNEIIDKCIECGFCEPNCVSADLTLSPRQRIVVQREISRLIKANEDASQFEELSKAYDYNGNQTCATDGLCALSCPVKIDTGALIKTIRNKEIGSSKLLANWIANHMSFVTLVVRKSLTLISFFHSVLGTKLMNRISISVRALSFNTIPLWNSKMPLGAKKIRINASSLDNNKFTRKVVYFPSCINRSMSTSKDEYKEAQLTDKMIGLLNKAGFEVIFPQNLNSLCCGMPFSSKGYFDTGLNKSSELEVALYEVSENGSLPILCDMSPCLYTMKENSRLGLQLYEPVTFINDVVLNYLSISPTDESIAVFPVCSMKKMGLDDKLIELARKCASDVTVPEVNCCGFSGDRGFLTPELNQHGLSGVKEQLSPNIVRGFSNSRTCEIGLSLHTGINHKSIIYLVDEVTSSLN